MKVTKFNPGGMDSILGGVLSTGTIPNAGNASAISGVTVQNAAASNHHIVAISSNSALWLPHASAAATDVQNAGRWELAVLTGSPPDPLYADGDFLYIWVPGA